MVVVTVGEIKAEPVYQLYLYRKIVSVLNSSLLFRYCFENLYGVLLFLHEVRHIRSMFITLKHRRFAKCTYSRWGTVPSDPRFRLAFFSILCR